MFEIFLPTSATIDRSEQVNQVIIRTNLKNFKLLMLACVAHLYKNSSLLEEGEPDASKEEQLEACAELLMAYQSGVHEEQARSSPYRIKDQEAFEFVLALKRFVNWQKHLISELETGRPLLTEEEIDFYDPRDTSCMESENE